MLVHVGLGISLPVGKMESTQMLLCCCAVDIVFHSTPLSRGGPLSCVVWCLDVHFVYKVLGC